MDVTFFGGEGRGRSNMMVDGMVLFSFVGELDGELIWVTNEVLRFLNILDLICLILLFFLCCLGERLSGKYLVCGLIRFG